MTNLPHVLLSVAMSVDGYIDDRSPDRLLLSNAEDFDRVDQVRADTDAILIGAGTLRADNPRLIVNSESRRSNRLDNGLNGCPLKVTVTASGNLDPAAKWFHHGDDKLVYTTTGAFPELSSTVGELAEVVDLGPTINFRNLAQDLGKRGVNYLMVEGGESVHTEFLTSGLVDELHIAVAPLLVGDGPRFTQRTKFDWESKRRMSVKDVRTIGDVVFINYVLPKEA